jgi:hypothetical protein
LADPGVSPDSLNALNEGWDTEIRKKFAHTWVDTLLAAVPV